MVRSSKPRNPQGWLGSCHDMDWALYGLLVRKHRIDSGFRKVEDFSRVIWRRTRFYLSRDTLYKIEQGRQIPDSSQFMALNLALFGNPFGGEDIWKCLPKEWRDITSVPALFVPDSWKEENSETVWREATGKVDCEDPRSSMTEADLLRLGGENSASLAGDDPALFSEAVDLKWRKQLESEYLETYGNPYR